MFGKEKSNKNLIEKILSIATLPGILLMVIGALIIITDPGIVIGACILGSYTFMIIFLLHNNIIIFPSSYLVGYMERCLPEVVYDFEHAKDDKDKKYFSDKIKKMVEFRTRRKYWNLHHPDDDIVESY